jgi:hypothetical protein
MRGRSGVKASPELLLANVKGDGMMDRESFCWWGGDWMALDKIFDLRVCCCLKLELHVLGTIIRDGICVQCLYMSCIDETRGELTKSPHRVSLAQITPLTIRRYHKMLDKPSKEKHLSIPDARIVGTLSTCSAASLAYVRIIISNRQP